MAQDPHARRKLQATGIDAICEAIAGGESYRSICKRIGVGHQTLYDFLANPAYAERHSRAREAKADLLLDELVDISDDSSNDSYIDANGNVRANHENVQRSRLRVETRKWVAMKLNPAKYGDRVEANNTSNPLADAIRRINEQGSALLPGMTIDGESRVIQAIEQRKNNEATDEDNGNDNGN